MLNIIERKIALQLLVFYSLFVIPLLLGGLELYFFQHDVLQQSAQRADSSLAQVIALDTRSILQATEQEGQALAQSQAAQQLNLQQLTMLFTTIHFSQPDEYVVCDASGTLLLFYPPGQSENQQNTCAHDELQAVLTSDQPLILSTQPGARTSTRAVLVATRITNAANQVIGILDIYLSSTIFTSRLTAIRQQFANQGEIRIWIIDSNGYSIANTEQVNSAINLDRLLPGIGNALKGKPGNIIITAQNRDWLSSFVPIQGTQWTVVVQRPTDAVFVAVTSFQNSLVIALIMLILGASFFWFAMHGWVVAPLSKLAQLVITIKPDQAEKATASKLLARERGRTDEIGRLIEAISTMEDEIHALFRKTDERSQGRLQTLDAIMRSMEEGVLLENPDGQIIYANRSLSRFVGISPQDITSDSFSDDHFAEKFLEIIEDREVYNEAVHRFESGKGTQVVEFQVRGYHNGGGQLVPVRRDIRMRMFYVRDLSGQVIGRGKIFHDVTQQNEAEQIKKNLLAIVSHELRSPLTSIKGYATSLLETDVELDEVVQRLFLQRIVEEGDRMAELVTSLLEMSQLEAGTLKLYPTVCRLATLLAQVVDEQDHIRINIATDVPLLYVDRRRIEMVLRNILENARRYARIDALIEISARYEHGQTDAAPGLYLTIADNGAGIPAHLTERIFESFYQVDSGRERGSSGIGLGLAICRGFIEAHGGRIWAGNRTDGYTGAIFSIWLPTKVLYTHDAQPDVFPLQNAL